MSSEVDTDSGLTREAEAIVGRARAWDAMDPAFGPDACERVLARVEALTGPATAPPFARRIPGRLVLATLLTAASIGGAIGAKSMLASPTTAAATSSPATNLPMTSPPAPSAELPSIDVTALPAAPRETPPSRAASAPAEGTTLAEELRLTTAARKALAASDAPGALRALEEHERRFPNGQLAQERDGVRIQALVAEGDLAAARSRAAAFRERYPGGLLVPSVARALDSHD